MGGRGWGTAYGHIKAFDLFPFPHQRKICTEGLQGRHALSMLGRTLVLIHCSQQTYIYTYISQYAYTSNKLHFIVNLNMAHLCLDMYTACNCERYDQDSIV